MRLDVLTIYILVLAIPLIKTEDQEVAAQEPEVTKLQVVNLGEGEIDPEQLDVQQRKRNSGYAYGRPNRVSAAGRFRFRAKQQHSSRGQQIASRPPARLNGPFAIYGPPGTSPHDHQQHHAQQHRNKLQQHQSLDGLKQQEIPSPIRNVDFALANPIASQNNEPFGMHTANYLPPQNQKLPAADVAHQHQVSDAALFLSENAQAIQQLYGAPASSQDFAPANEQLHADGNRLGTSLESTLQSPPRFTLPAYASGTLNAHETLEQIQSLEKDRLIVQLQQALARYAQNQAGFAASNEEALLASISQQAKSHVTTTPQSFGFETAAFSQSPFLPGTTIAHPLDQTFAFNYGVSTTTRTPPTTTTITTTTGALPPKDDGQVASPQPVGPHRPASVPTSAVAGVPVYGGFVPTLIANFIPSYGSGVLTPVRPAAQPTSATSSPTHFGIPIPTEAPAGKPQSASPPATPPVTTTPSSFKPSLEGSGQTPGFAITPVALPSVQPIRPVAAPLHPLIGNPVLSVAPGQVQPAVQTALVNPVVYKALKAVYPLYYYPHVAFQSQKPGASLPSYPWSYAPSYHGQTKPAQIWK